MDKRNESGDLIILKEELAFLIDQNAKSAVELVFANVEKAKRAAELILKNNELNQCLHLNADKDLLISILAHDLKSPFNAILGLSEELNENIHKYDSAEIEKIANDINKSAQNAYNLLEDILMWARAQQGDIRYKPQILSFKDICIKTLEILNPSAKAKNIIISYSEVDQINVFADIDILKIVLRNLVSNAIKFTNNGGLIKINAEEKSETVNISVSDNGIGIFPENITKLFDISKAISTTGTAKETGTGLGLLLCKALIEKHGGRIWVESVVGNGSEFKFTLPIHNEHVNAVFSEKS